MYVLIERILLLQNVVLAGNGKSQKRPKARFTLLVL